MTNSSPIVLLACDGDSTRHVYHALRREFGDVQVVLESRVSRGRLIRGRLRRLGFLETAGQVAFMVLAHPLIRRSSQARLREIQEMYGLDGSPTPGSALHVPSVNSPEAREALARLKPAVVVVNGTRIIGRETLSSIACPVINTHAGITPLYRGTHGAYWALAEGRPDLAGTTVHYVDEGIDTGRIIGQATFSVSPKDSFATYPYLHTAAGLPVLISAVHDALSGTLSAQREVPQLASRLRFHPTLWGYVVRRLLKDVR